MLSLLVAGFLIYWTGLFQKASEYAAKKVYEKYLLDFHNKIQEIERKHTAILEQNKQSLARLHKIEERKLSATEEIIDLGCRTYFALVNLSSARQGVRKKSSSDSSDTFNKKLKKREEAFLLIFGDFQRKQVLYSLYFDAEIQSLLVDFQGNTNLFYTRIHDLDPLHKDSSAKDYDSKLKKIAAKLGVDLNKIINTARKKHELDDPIDIQKLLEDLREGTPPPS